MKRLPVVLIALAALSVLAASVALAAPGAPGIPARPGEHQQTLTFGGPRTPITHVVEIFQENVSFDHYFGTYPNAANTDGQPFEALPGTPAVDGLPPATSASLPPSLRHATNLLTENPNAAQPQRLNSSPTGLPGSAGGQLTCDQDHNYSDEQKAFDSGRMDKFIESLGNGGGKSPAGAPCNKETVMDYYDGNTVTGLWNYAQHYAMSDNSYGTTFGPSSPGAINLISGNIGDVDMTHTANNPSIATPTSPNADLTANGKGGYALTSDAQPYWDDCSTRDAVALSGKNIGDLLNEAGLSWGWFEGGFRPTTSYQAALEATGHTGQPTSTFIPDEFKAAEFNKAVPHSSNQGLCNAVSPVGEGLGGTGQWGYKNDYIPHHEPFQYYASTANPHHLTIPTNGKGRDTLAGLATIGTDTQSYVDGQPQFNTPNHNYDMSDFDQLMAAITNHELPPSAMPAVSFLKAPGYQDGHAAYSDPQDEQEFIAHTVNEIMASPDWRHTAIVINYDDSDGWYDHANPGVLNPSLSAADNLTNTTLTGATSGQCGPNPQTAAPLGGEQGRCGLGPRLPMLVISPYAKSNSVDHNLSNQASTINFIEYNWGLPSIPGSFDQAQAKVDRAERVPFDLAGMFRFNGQANPALPLNPVTGQPVELEEGAEGEEGNEWSGRGGGNGRGGRQGR
ncbi:MAG: alkaline phosphatase family protein [Actinobacteria bacterium]|nr:alkaline phosphatase family protein [Actinomycetota bacterium]